jgi:hypothetical protein
MKQKFVLLKILERETIDNDDDDDDHINEFNENELQFDEKNDESMEKSTCCFGTGRSRYELSLTINNDYFTPPTKSFSQPSQPDRSRSNSTGSSSFSSFFSMFKLNK